MAAFQKIALDATGTTSTHTTGSGIIPTGRTDTVCLEFIIEAVGATPTITWKLQASFDNVNFVDVELLPAASETAVATVTQTGTGTYHHFVAQSAVRKWPYYQIVSSSNTNVTYRSNLWIHAAAK